MIKTDANKSSLKEIREREKKQKDAELKSKCQEMADKSFGADEIVKMSNANKGLFFLPVFDDDGETIASLVLMKPIDRHILSYASTKITDEGLYIFLEQCMRECFVASIEPDGTVSNSPDGSVVIVDDEYFIPAAMKFNAIIESRKAALLKR